MMTKPVPLSKRTLAILIVVASACMTSRVSYAVDCGDKIGPGGKVTLTGDITGCGVSPALTVEGPVTLDLNGYTLSCLAGGIGIEVQGKNATIIKGSITACDYAVLGIDTNGHTLEKLNLLGPVELYGHRNQIVSTTFQVGDPCLWVEGNGNAIINNTLRSGADGIFVEGDRNRLINNAVSEGNDPIQVFGHRNRIEKNVAINADSGITVFGDTNRISRNTLVSIFEQGILLGGDSNSLATIRPTAGAPAYVLKGLGIESSVMLQSATFGISRIGVQTARAMLGRTIRLRQRCQASVLTEHRRGTVGSLAWVTSRKAAYRSKGDVTVGAHLNLRCASDVSLAEWISVQHPGVPGTVSVTQLVDVASVGCPLYCGHRAAKRQRPELAAM